MQLIRAALLACLLFDRGEAVEFRGKITALGLVKQRGARKNGAQGVSSQRVTTVDQCVATATEFLGDAKRASDGGQITSLHAIEKATDYCALKYRKDDENYVCTHFRQFLNHAFHDLDDPKVKDRTITVQRFCEWAENHYAAMRQQTTQLTDVAEGADILHFKLSDKCPAAVSQGMAPEKTMPKEKVPDFWYAFCVSQDCAHYLPSRTKWCDINLPHPRHTIEVCELAREYAIQDVAAFKGAEMNAEEICDSYGRFMEDVKVAVEAYAHVMHGETKDDIPVPTDRVRALTSSQLINDAAGHNIRDHTAHKVTPYTETKEEPYYHSAATKSITHLWMTLLVPLVMMTV